MGAEELRGALRDANEVDLTVTGRRSGQESSRPVWFVEDGEKLLLLPVGGSDSNWYKNLRKTPAVGLAASGAELHTDAKPLDDPATVDHVVEAFGAKYGADRVEEYYPSTTSRSRSRSPDPNQPPPGRACASMGPGPDSSAG